MASDNYQPTDYCMYLITIAPHYYECVAISWEMQDASEEKADNSNNVKHHIQLPMQM